MALSKHAYIYKAMGDAIDAFGERHHLTGRQHFAPLLRFTGSNGHIQLGSHLNYTTYNPANVKPLSVDHLCVLLRELEDDREIVLDAIAKEYGYILIQGDEVQPSTQKIHALTDSLSMETAEAFRVIKQALADNKLTHDERLASIKELHDVIRDATQLIQDLEVIKDDTQENL